MLVKLSEQADNDEEYQKLISAILNDFNKHSMKCDYVRQFFKMKNDLSIENGLVLRGCQIVIPPSAIKDVVSKLHQSHQGVEKTKRRVRQTVFWPGYSNDIKNAVDSCHACQYYRPSPPPEPLVQENMPSRAFKMVTTDLFQHGGAYYLIYADRFTGFPLIERFPNSPSASDLVESIRRLFSLTGAPNVLRSDQGPQYSSQVMQDFLESWSVKWKPSSPHHPQSNGHAEVSVKITKYLLAKVGGKINSDEFQAGLLELRNGPREDGLSPAQRLFGHPLRSQVPANWRSFTQEWQISADKADHHRLESEAKRKFYFDRSSAPLDPIPVGSSVIIQDPVTK